MRKSFILLLAFFLCVTGYAQKLTISGVVIDKDLNEPLTGVNVLVKGTTTGTITDFDGKYTLEADANSILVFSYLRWVLSIPFFISCIRQQNPLTVLSKIILRKVKQFNLPPPKK